MICRFSLALVLGLLLAGAAPAQVREPGNTLSAGEGAGTLSDISTPLRNPSIAVHDGARTIGESSGGSMRSGSVRDGTTRSMLSGPVSEVSQGPMRQQQLPLSGGSQTEASAGAVKHDIDSPLGERISQPLRELGPLQEQMRQRRQQAEQAALADATAPVAASMNGATLGSQGALRHDLAQAPDEGRLQADGDPALADEGADGETAGVDDDRALSGDAPEEQPAQE